LRLTKHHGLGNDFLVLLADIANSADLARPLCDRRRGIGADGLIVGRPPSPGTAGADPAGAGVDVVMDLRNADGSIAEMSGNGIRCLAQAVVRANGQRHATTLVIDTLAGRRTVDVRPTADPDVIEATVAMGAVSAGPPLPAALPDGLAHDLGRAGEVTVATADIGNPHAVFLAADPAAVDLRRYGAAIEAATPGGINVEFIRPTPGEVDAIDLTVWERGAGITSACGTGASAAAVVAHRWGLVGPRVTVHLPGGDVGVVVGEGETLLTGPAVYVATIDVGAAVGGGVATGGPPVNAADPGREVRA
jgi:diaminopimelate epimerase